MPYRSLVVEPRLRTDAREDADRAIAAALAECGAAGLVADTCPSDVVSRVVAGGNSAQVDPATVRWTASGESEVVPGEEDWTLGAGYTLTFTRADGKAETLKLDILASIARDDGEIVVDLQ